jgi:hypothetical protein
LLTGGEGGGSRRALVSVAEGLCKGHAVPHAGPGDGQGGGRRRSVMSIWVSLLLGLTGFLCSESVCVSSFLFQKRMTSPARLLPFSWPEKVRRKSKAGILVDNILLHRCSRYRPI